MDSRAAWFGKTTFSTWLGYPSNYEGGVVTFQSRDSIPNAIHRYSQQAAALIIPRLSNVVGKRRRFRAFSSVSLCSTRDANPPNTKVVKLLFGVIVLFLPTFFIVMKCLIAMLSCGKHRRWRIHRPPHSRWDLGIYQVLELLTPTICRSPVETAVVPGLVKCVCVPFVFLVLAFSF